MHNAVRSVIIFLILFLSAGCSALRKSRSDESAKIYGNTDYHSIIENVTTNNVTDGGFEIRKGSIKLEGTQIEGTFGLNARLNSRGDFYASVRGPLGIELVRILMVENDIAAIDRFNRKVYVGSKSEVLRNNGMPEDFMRIVFGDIPAGRDLKLINSEKNELTVADESQDFRNVIRICIESMKVCAMNIDANNSEYELYMTFGPFAEAQGRKYPAEISVEERKKMFHVKLFIDDLIYGYDSDIEYKLPSYKRESF